MHKRTNSARFRPNTKSLNSLGITQDQSMMSESTAINDIGFRTQYKFNTPLLEQRKNEMINSANNKLQELKFDKMVEQRLGLDDKNNFIRNAGKQQKIKAALNIQKAELMSKILCEKKQKLDFLRQKEKVKSMINKIGLENTDFMKENP